MEANADLLRFAGKQIAFRHAHHVLRNRWHLSGQDLVGSGYPDISWHGTSAWQPDWSGSSRTLAFMLSGANARGGTVQDNFVYVAMNTHWDSHWFGLPQLPDNMRWHVFANTSPANGQDIWEPGQEPLLDDQGGLLVGDRSIVIMVGK